MGKDDAGVGSQGDGGGGGTVAGSLTHTLSICRRVGALALATLLPAWEFRRIGRG